MNLYYLAIPRTGSTYCKKVLEHEKGHRFFYFDESEKLEDRIKLYEQFYREKDQGKAVCFTTIRNPYDLLVSWWTKKHQSNPARGKLVAFRWIMSGPKEHENVYGETFPQFVKNFYSQRFNNDSFQYYQKNFLYYNLFNVKGDCVPDFILRTENLSEELYNLCDSIDIKVGKKEKINASANKTDYKSFYNHNTKQLVSLCCDRECQLFGYDWDGIISRFVLDPSIIKYSVDKNEVL